MVFGETAQIAVDLYNANAKAQIALHYEDYCRNVEVVKARMAEYPAGSVPANWPAYETEADELRRLRKENAQLRRQRNPLIEYCEAIDRGEA